MTIRDLTIATLGGLGTDPDDYDVQLTGGGAAITVVTDPITGSGSVAKCALGVGDTRAELSCQSNRDPLGAQLWYTWECLIPADYVQNSEQMVIMQVHEEPDTSPADYSGFPQFAQFIQNDRVYFRNSYDANTQSTSGTLQTRGLCSVPLADVIGRWVRWTVNVRWDWDTDGYLHIYLDRRRIFTEPAKANAIKHASARGGNDPYMKMKIGYYGVGGAATVANHVFHRGLKRGDSSETFATMTGLTTLEPIIYSGAALGV